jgi:methylglutaconyl-CoA hydratase
VSRAWKGSKDYQMTAQLIQEVDERGVLRLTLDRPDVRNAFGAELIESLTDALARANTDPGVRAVVITGSGQSFSAGADLNWMRSMLTATPEENEQDALALARLLRVLNYLSRPTITRINGSAFGGALGLISCCDISISTDNALFGLTEVRLGLVPAVISPYVIRRIGETHARRYFLTAERFDAHRAREIGLVSELADPGKLDEAVNSQLDQLLKAGPLASRHCKELISRVSGHDEKAQKETDAYTARLIAKLRVSEEGQEGLAAFLEKRLPQWCVKHDD